MSSFPVTGVLASRAARLPDLRSALSEWIRKEFLHGFYNGGSHGGWRPSAQPQMPDAVKVRIVAETLRPGCDGCCGRAAARGQGKPSFGVADFGPVGQADAASS